jgi:hypothetical protein
MAVCYRLGESELTARTSAAWNDGVMIPLYRAGGRRSSGGQCQFDGLQWGNVFTP